MVVKLIDINDLFIFGFGFEIVIILFFVFIIVKCKLVCRLCSVFIVKLVGFLIVNIVLV